MAGEPIVTIVGNLVADPEPRVSQAGKSWATFRIASTPRVRNSQSNEFEDGEALFVSGRVYGTYADHVVASLSKGTRVIALGKLTQRSYTDNQGNPRTSLELEVDEIGPALRFATASVTRGGSGGPAGGGWAPPTHGAQPQYGSTPGGGYGAPAQQAPAQAQGQSAWGAPPAAPHAPAPAAAGSGFDDEQPF